MKLSKKTILFIQLILVSLICFFSNLYIIFTFNIDNINLGIVKYFLALSIFISTFIASVEYLERLCNYDKIK